MISGVFGLTGAGKSTFLAWCAARVQAGRPLSLGFAPAGGVVMQDERSCDYDRIYSNFPLLGCYPLEWDELGVFEYSHCLILIDEIMMLCDSRQWKQYPESIKYFMSHHRHYHTDIIFCSQSYKDTDLRIRNLAQQYLYIERAGAFTRVSPIHHLMDIKQGSIDDWYEKGGRLASRYIRRAKYYHMFDSHSKKPLLQLPEKNLWEIIPDDDRPTETTTETTETTETETHNLIAY